MRRLPKFIPSATSTIFQNLCSCSLCKNIDITHSIEVSNPIANGRTFHTRVHLMSRIDYYTKNNFSFLRSKIRELHPVHRASLEALLRHLLNVTSHSDKNEMTVKTLSSHPCGYVLGLDTVTADGINMKARYIDLS